MSTARLEHTLNFNSAGGFRQDTADESLFNAVTLQEKEIDRQTEMLIYAHRKLII